MRENNDQFSVQIVNTAWHNLEVQIVKVATVPNGHNECRTVERFRYTDRGAYRYLQALEDARFFARSWSDFLGVEPSEFIPVIKVFASDPHVV